MVHLPNLCDMAVSLEERTVTSQDVRESKPKTGRGRRPLELDEDTHQALLAWQERQEAERKEWPGEWPDHGLVFTLEDGSPLHPDYLSRAFRSHQRRVAKSLAERAAKDARKGRKLTLPTIRFHDLRHTHATLLLAAGVPVKVVSERLGHSTPAFTMAVYQHVLPGDQRGHVQNVANAKTKAARHLQAVNS